MAHPFDVQVPFQEFVQSPPALFKAEPAREYLIGNLPHICPQSIPIMVLAVGPFMFSKGFFAGREGLC